ncbi:hypothetical protein BO221_18820 [Archangium sp. Cb G35]|uniref:DUF2381 family protein n=1 Tax=Archangium sp. Cb G35 TaxID=1920190 RepID=UPI00093609DF|nr:DUF2381 family protein [Archangium sp. Cb G35]OJT22953.1 hypothetical protein BO221_18820 [Archangium sp. Cb G35]
MLPPSPGALLALALLAGAAQAAEAPPSPRCAATPRVDVAPDSTRQASEVCVSPDETTTFVFDSRLATGAVEVQPEGRLADWTPGKEGLTLHVIPRGDFLPGERVKVIVRFEDGAAPASATFWLVGHVARGARRVEVFRQPRPADVLQKEKDEAQAEARQCQEDKVRLLAERKEPGGLMGAAWLEREKAVESRDIWKDLKHDPANALWTEAARSYTQRQGKTHPGGMAVRLQLANPGAEPWTAAGAVLKDSTGAEVALSAWQASAIDPGALGSVVVGAEREPGQLACPCSLKLWEAQGPRTVSLENVTFPFGEQAGKQGAARE